MEKDETLSLEDDKKKSLVFRQIHDDTIIEDHYC